ncbi:MAG TPA: threonine--tRNA ligase [Thermoplasmata archaeon]|nr:threonine--tRNA ligase [Thermoplasmata archaeon]
MGSADAVDVALPDGVHRSVAPGSTVGDVLRAWRVQEFPGYLAASWDGRPVDLARPIDRSGTLAPIRFSDPAGREIVQHSAAHLVAKALTELIPSALPTSGPPTEEGFYYDFDVRPLVPEDLAHIRELAARSVQAREPFERVEVSKEEARAWVASNRHKLAYLSEVPEGERVSFYRTGKFLDLCRGPHVPHTGWLGGVHLFGVSGIAVGEGAAAESRQRVRGVAFPSKGELDTFLKLRAEAEARDHRVVGPRLGLFMFMDEAPGFPFWLPKGMVVVRELERFVTEHFQEDGYQEVRTPLMFAQSVFETSGHWDHYRENIFLTEADGRAYGVKPMNCPGSMLIFRSSSRSYRDLPMRLAEFAPLHRLERSGTLHGLTRVREMVQDDAHLFVAEEQIEGEVAKLLAWIARAFTTFRLGWSYELSTRPTHFLGEAAQWDRAEATLERALKASNVEYRISAGEGAFYGPKIDIHVRDSLGRPWQTGTIQLDYQIPARFGLAYQGADGQMHTPIVIHRTILGTWERFLGVLLEHCAGRLPPWLSPVQVRILPVADRHEPLAQQTVRGLAAKGLRADLSASSETLSKRVREAELEKVPWVAVIGDAEASTGALAVRTHGKKGQRTLTPEAFLTEVRSNLAERRFEP